MSKKSYAASGVAAVVIAGLNIMPAFALDFVRTQASNEFRASVLTGTTVQAKNGDVVGNVNDVVFTQDGAVTAIIIGVGGMLGVGEKNVAVAFKDLTVTTTDGKRIAMLDVTKEQLQSAPAYEGEKTTFEKVQEGAQSLAEKAREKAIELQDATKKPPETPPTTTPPQNSGSPGTVN